MESFPSVWLGIVTWVFTALLLLLAFVSTLAARGILRRNRLLGIRLASLERSDDAWAAGHRAALPIAWAGFVLALVCAVLGMFIPPVHWAVLAAFVVVGIWAFIAATRAARRGDVRS